MTSNNCFSRASKANRNRATEGGVGEEGGGGRKEWFRAKLGEGEVERNMGRRR